ncbi:MAG TPA: O-antigen ligase family protein [Chitinophagaceae bacterium]
MNNVAHENKTLSLLLYIAYVIFSISLVFSFRAISSVSIGLILLTGLIKNKMETGKFVIKRGNFFLTACILYFLLQCIGLLYQHDTNKDWNTIRLKTGLIIMPLAIYCSEFLTVKRVQQLFSFFSIILFAGSLYCLIVSFFHYSWSGDSSLFFYHNLVSPIRQHAVYFSVYVFIALVFLSEGIRRNNFVFTKYFHYYLIFYFIIFLFLLSSKLVIGFYIIYLIYYFFVLVYTRTVSTKKMIPVFLVLIAATATIFLTGNKISDRFAEIFQGNISVVKQETFSPGDYFNGLQFRLLQWKLVPAILAENKSWWTGVSPGNAQSLLDKKYIEKNMYTGDPMRQGHGYLGYNTHNQFLQSLLQNGIPGLAAFLFLCYALLRIAWLRKHRLISFVILLILAFACTESLLETQYGLILFTFFPLFTEAGSKANLLSHFPD